MSQPPIQYTGPSDFGDVPPSSRRWFQLIFQKLGNHTQAFQLLSEQIATATATGTTTPATSGVINVGGGGTGSQTLPQNAVIIGNGASPVQSASPIQAAYVLTDNGPGRVPSFQPLPTAPLTIVLDSGPYTAVAGNVVLCNTAAGGFTVTLPLAASNKAQPILVKKISSDGNHVTVGTISADVIDGSSTQTLASQYSALTMIADSGNWNIFAKI